MYRKLIYNVKNKKLHLFGGKSRDSFANFGHCCPFFLQRLILDAEVTG